MMSGVILGSKYDSHDNKIDINLNNNLCHKAAQGLKEFVISVEFQSIVHRKLVFYACWTWGKNRTLLNETAG